MLRVRCFDLSSLFFLLFFNVRTAIQVRDRVHCYFAGSLLASVCAPHVKDNVNVGIFPILFGGGWWVLRDERRK